MGFLGWDVISGGTTVLRGVVLNAHLVHATGDNDWSVTIRPNRDYRFLLTNQDGFTNGGEAIECEIDPPHNIFGQDAETDTVADKFLGHLVNLPARAQGLWVRDLSHDVWGNEPDGPPLTSAWDSNPGKTEIHPMISLLVKHAAPNSKTRRFEFFAFSDEDHRPVLFPDPIGAGQSKLADFALAIPLGTTMTKVAGGNEGMVASVSFGTQARKGYAVLKGTVSSGKPDQGKGFYHVVFDVPALFSVRALLESPWDVHKPGPCDALAYELNQMKKGEFDTELKKWLPAFTDDEIAAKQQELNSCLAKAKQTPKPPLSLRDALDPPEQPASPECAQLKSQLDKMTQGEFDTELKKWIPSATPQEIAAKRAELKECLHKHPPPPPEPASVRALIEAAYP
jgi:hypothetical protein